MNFHRHLLTIVIAIAGSTPALGQSDMGCAVVHRIDNPVSSEVIEPPDQELIVNLINWIAHQTRYDVASTLAAPPIIRFCKSGEAIDYESEVIMVEPHLRAAYDLKSRVIYLVTPWRASRIEDQGVLLHELIHEVQFRAREWDCLQQPEYEAYSLHAVWLEEHNLPVPFDLSQVFIRSRCDSSHH